MMEDEDLLLSNFNEEEESSSNTEIEITILFTSGDKLKIKVQKTWTILRVIEEIKKHTVVEDDELEDGSSTKIKISGNHIKLICKGRFLIPSQTITQSHVHKGESIHCLCSKVSSNSKNDAHGSSTFHRSIPDRQNQSDVGDDEHTGLLDTRRIFNQTHDDDADIEEHLRIRRGFETMMDAGFSEEAIREFRNQFYVTRPNLLRDVQEGRMTLSELQDIEEAWMEQEVQHPLMQPASEGTVVLGHYEGGQYDFFFGILLGFFLGVIVFLWRKERAVPHTFTMGVILGVMANIILATIYVFISLV
mmetsp:Transcript_3637/g.5375  ORF Transcript_3637/g.5375 Transcript_3637/m.5375 type:complete len:304 (+) Transcript_3637:175-1086(+)